jgi:hypothetical protein
MTTARSAGLRSGTWLVIGLLALATVLVVISRVYRVPPQDNVRDMWGEEGFPAARRGMALAQKGKRLLPLEEQREMEAIYAEALRTLTPEEKQRFVTLAQKSTAATDSEIAESGDLAQKALRSLSQDKQTRLWSLIEKAVQLQVAQEKTATATGKQ